jgi:hypothetical protein
VRKIVVTFASIAASVIVTPNSMVRTIVSATTAGGQAVTSGNGHLGGVGGAACLERLAVPARSTPVNGQYSISFQQLNR